MNKTININLAGQLFYMDDNAYSMLKKYLSEIAAYFKESNIKEELISDIESRIAELFIEKLAHERQVVGVEEVSYVIEIMGQPKEYQLSEEEIEHDSKKEKKKERTFFRDPDDSMLGGVAAGLAHYFGLQVSWVRLIWLLLAIFSWGGFIVIYFALWIFVAPAKTTAEKLSMKGEPINISTLEKKFREGIDDVTDRIKDVDYESATKKAHNGLQHFANTFVGALHKLIKVLGKLIGVALIVISYSVIFALLIALFSIGLADIFDFPFSNTDEFLAFHYWDIPFWLAGIPVLFLVGIPFAFMAILGQGLLKNSKKSNQKIFSVLLGIWMISILATIVFGMSFLSATL